MKQKHIEIINAMCDCSMTVSKVAKKLYLCRATVEYHITAINKKYGLDPRRYRDLKTLEEMVMEVSKNGVL